MKKILYIISIISIVLTSCSKEKGDDLPINDPTGSYFYQSNSTYYTPQQKIKFVGSAEGGVSVIDNFGDISISVTPYFGYKYTVMVENPKVYGDTTVFSIPTQQVYLDGYNYNLFGTSDVEVKDIGFFDGYVTSDSLVLKYRSNNVATYEYVKTKIRAKKKN